jgi:hypothetical protein
VRFIAILKSSRYFQNINEAGRARRLNARLEEIA